MLKMRILSYHGIFPSILITFIVQDQIHKSPNSRGSSQKKIPCNKLAGGRVPFIGGAIPTKFIFNVYCLPLSSSACNNSSWMLHMHRPISQSNAFHISSATILFFKSPLKHKSNVRRWLLSCETQYLHSTADQNLPAPPQARLPGITSILTFLLSSFPLFEVILMTPSRAIITSPTHK